MTEATPNLTPSINAPRLMAELINTHWDVCIVGDGAAALWTAYGLSRGGQQKVLWVTNDELGTASRMVAKHAWAGPVSQVTATAMNRILGTENSENNDQPLNVFYFDAKSSKRFKPIQESKPQWGDHELPWLKDLLKGAGVGVDISGLQDRICQQVAAGGSHVVLARSYLIIGFNTENSDESRITSLLLAQPGDKEAFAVKAKRFVLAELGAESYRDLVANENAADLLSAAQKGKSYRAGYSLHFRHSDLGSLIENATLVVPLVANPSKKGEGAHVVGRFFRNDGGQWASVWFGLVADEELDDNNEILKKMKASKRVIDKALPGFLDSVVSEAMQFEPQMMAMDLLKERPSQVMNVAVVGDALGVDAALRGVELAIQ
jgi:hypothetical protein